jgi:two-component system, LytTR family, sensor kinase
MAVSIFTVYSCMKKIHAVALHLLFWLYRFGWDAITLTWRKPGVSFRADDIFNIFANSFYFLSVSTFYINYLLIMPRFFRKKKNLQLALCWLLLLAYFIGMRYFIEEYLYVQWFNAHNYPDDVSVAFYIVDNLYFGGSIIVPSIVLWIIIHWMKVEKEKLALKEAAGTAEINFLKSQVNPHFLFNTLNNIYSLVYHQSDKALPAIMRLSELMRYMTRESSVNSIQLDKEIAYINSFLELESLRIAGESYIQFETEGNTNVMIAPLMLIPFVENGFKHGVVTDPSHPFMIRLSVNADKVLQLHTSNKINQSQKDNSGGVGLQNVRRRLELIYPGRHSMETTKKDDHYICSLTIHL